MNIKKVRLLPIIFLAIISLTPSSYASSLYSPLTTDPPVIDGIVSLGEWTDAPMLPLPHGYLLSKHDHEYLYILIDLTGDTVADPPLVAPPWGDYLWVTFDIGSDGVITPYADLQYNVFTGTHALGVQYYLNPCTWSSISSTSSKLGAGFGPSHISAVNHRFWELAIDMDEIMTFPMNRVRVGVKTYSQNPSFEDYVPSAFCSDFSDLIEIVLSPPVGGEILSNNVSTNGSLLIAGISTAAVTAALANRKRNQYNL